MASLTRLNRRLHRWTRYAARTYWSPRISQPEPSVTNPRWMGRPRPTAGHGRAWRRLDDERWRRAERERQLLMVPAAPIAWHWKPDGSGGWYSGPDDSTDGGLL